jgi:hypothetical protein
MGMRSETMMFWCFEIIACEELAAPAERPEAQLWYDEEKNSHSNVGIKAKYTFNSH